jgi:hypothetical protein
MASPAATVQHYMPSDRPVRDNQSFTFHCSEDCAGMTIESFDGTEIALGASEMRELFQFLLHHAQDIENTCCWNGCTEHGKAYKVKRVHVNTTRFYCDRHAFAAELAGFIVAPRFARQSRGTVD